MKRTTLLITMLLTFIGFNHLAAQISDLKNTYKGVVKIISYKADGSIFHDGTGVFLNKAGDCAAPFELLKGAYAADIIDFKGNKRKAWRILGAEGFKYNLVTFSTTAEGKKNEPEFFSIGQSPEAGATTYLLHYTTNKKDKPQTASIVKSEEFEGGRYMHTTVPNKDTNFGCPIVNENGALVGFVQQNVEKKDSTSCAIDAGFISKLHISSMSALNPELRQIFIPKALPKEEKEALTYLAMINTADSVMAITSYNDFITSYPQNAEGYVIRGKFFASKEDFAHCEADFENALKQAGNTASTMKADEVHNELSKIVFQKAVYNAKKEYKDWNIAKALKEAESAYSLNPQPFYLLQQGRCLFADKKYKEAYDKFHQLATLPSQNGENQWSDQAKAENWFYAARALELSGGDSLQVIALIDSAIALCPKPYNKTAAQYFLERGQRYHRINELRKAVSDYNTYENTVGPANLGADFYYLREQAELGCRMFQQALDDIQSAILREPTQVYLQLEQAIVMLRAGLFKQCIEYCQKLIQIHSDIADIYKIKGIAHGELKQKQQALSCLTKAKQMGDTTADSYIQKYK